MITPFPLRSSHQRVVLYGIIGYRSPVTWLGSATDADRCFSLKGGTRHKHVLWLLGIRRPHYCD